MSGLILALPSKGRLQEQVQAYFADCGLPYALDGGDRGYSARMKALPEVEVRLLSASDIARALLDGEAHFGVTGQDLLEETAGEGEAAISIRALGFGRADLVVAAPAGWLDVATMADLGAVAAESQARTGRMLRVATKYLTLTRRFFAAQGLSAYRLVESLGATEGAPAAGMADVIVDITTTGATLAANHLRPLEDGLILKSEAQLAASAKAAWTGPARLAAARLLAPLSARAAAKALRLVSAEWTDAGAVEAAAAAHGARADGAGGLLCPKDQVFALTEALRPLCRGVISVRTADFLFEAPDPLHAKLQRSLAPA